MEEKRDRPDMNQIKDLMTCPVCAQLFREPKILPCLHSFCTPCLENLVSYDAQQRSSLICPQCRRRVQIPGEGVSSLQTNLFAQNMLTVIALDNSSVNQISCENCISKEPPVSRCTLCRKFLCNFCTTAHRRSRDTVDHQLSTLEDVRSCLPGELAKPLFCNIHKKEKLVLYCESCQSSVCRDCTMMEHRSHKYAFAKEIYNKERGKIAEQLSEARSMGLFLKQGLAAVSEMRTSVDERTRAMIKELNEIFTQCMRTINERYSFLYNQVQNIRNERLLHLDAQKSELEYAFGSIQSSIGFTELTLRNSTQVEVLAMKKYIMDRMKELTGGQYNCVPVADDNIRLTVDGSVMQLLSQLGTVEDTNTSPSASLVTGIDAPVVARQMGSFLVQCYDGRGNPRAKGGDRVVVTVQSTDESALSVKTEKCFQAQVIDRQNGCYTVTYTPLTSGEHLVTVFINGMVVKGSPFSVHVQENSLILQPATPSSPSTSQNDDGSTLGESLLHFVSTSQAFETELVPRPELKRVGQDIDAPISGKKFKLEPNDLSSLPDQLFAHSPDVSRIKLEHAEPPSMCEYIQESECSKEEDEARQCTTSTNIPEVKQEQEESSPAPSSTDFLADHIDLHTSNDFRVKFADSGFLNPSSTESMGFHSPVHHSDDLTAPSSTESTVKYRLVSESEHSITSSVSSNFPAAYPGDSPTHAAAYNMNTPEPVFNINEKRDEEEKNIDHEAEPEGGRSEEFVIETQEAKEDIAAIQSPIIKEEPGPKENDTTVSHEADIVTEEILKTSPEQIATDNCDSTTDDQGDEKKANDSDILNGPVGL